MPNEKKGGALGAWTAFAGLTPMFVFSNGLSIGLALGMTFLLVNSAAAAIALLLPTSLGRAKIFAFSMLGAAFSASLSASLVRVLDPFLFEAAYARIYLAAFLIPVMKAALPPETVGDRERAWEHIIRGLAYALIIVVVGAAREFVASGAVSVTQMGKGAVLLPFAVQPAGGLILLGLAAAGWKAATAAIRGGER
jgi:hypothetical protein